MAPSATSSPLPPTAVATTGRPVAIASRTVFDIPSARDGRTNRSMARSSSGTSSRGPGIHTRSATPPSARTRATSPRSAPSPTSARATRPRHPPSPGSALSSATKARARLTGSLMGSIRPTQPTTKASRRPSGRTAFRAASGPPAGWKRSVSTPLAIRSTRSARTPTRVRSHPARSSDTATKRCTNGLKNRRSHRYAGRLPSGSNTSRPCSPWTRFGTPARKAGRIASRPDRLRVWTTSGRRRRKVRQSRKARAGSLPGRLWRATTSTSGRVRRREKPASSVRHTTTWRQAGSG